MTLKKTCQCLIPMPMQIKSNKFQINIHRLGSGSVGRPSIRGSQSLDSGSNPGRSISNFQQLRHQYNFSNVPVSRSCEMLGRKPMKFSQNQNRLTTNPRTNPKKTPRYRCFLISRLIFLNKAGLIDTMM